MISFFLENSVSFFKVRKNLHILSYLWCFILVLCFKIHKTIRIIFFNFKTFQILIISSNTWNVCISILLNFKIDFWVRKEDIGTAQNYFWQRQIVLLIWTIFLEQKCIVILHNLENRIMGVESDLVLENFLTKYVKVSDFEFGWHLLFKLYYQSTNTQTLGSVVTFSI